MPSKNKSAYLNAVKEIMKKTAKANPIRKVVKKTVKKIKDRKAKKIKKLMPSARAKDAAPSTKASNDRILDRQGNPLTQDRKKKKHHGLGPQMAAPSKLRRY